MTDDRRHQGWTNCETFVVQLQIRNDRHAGQMLHTIAVDNAPDTFMEDRVRRLRAWVEIYYGIPRYDLAATLCNSALDRVNWDEIIEREIEREKEASR